MKNMRGLWLLCILIGFPSVLWAQEESPEDEQLYLEDETVDEGLFDLDLEDLLNVVVSSTKTEQKIEEAPSIVAIITADEIKTYGYRTVADALRTVPGIYIRDDLIHPNVAMRGIDSGLRGWSRNIKVMINGHPILYRSDTSNWMGPELIAMEAISRIEIIRGPVSPLYGANAFLGVINIITKKPNDTEYASVTLNTQGFRTACPSGNDTVTHGNETFDTCGSLHSNFQPSDASMSAVVSHRWTLSEKTDVSFLAATVAGYSDRSGLVLPSSSPHFSKAEPRYFQGPDSDIISKNDTDKPLGIFGFVELENADWGKFNLEGQFSQFERYGEFTDWGVLTHENRIGMRNYYIRLTHDKTLSKIPLSFVSKIGVAGGGTTDQNHLQIAQDNNFWVKKEGGYLGWDLAFETRYNFNAQNMLTVGVDLSADDHDLPSTYVVSKTDVPGQSNEIPSHLLGNKTFVNFGAFGQALLSPAKPLNFLLGIRYDAHNVYAKECSISECPSLNGRAGLTYTFLDREKLKLHTKALYGTSFMAPSAELIYGTPYVTSGISGNRDLDVQMARTAELAFGSTMFKHVDFMINGFFTRINSKVEYIQNGNFIQAVNSADLDTLGVEASLEVSYKYIKGFSNASWQFTEAKKCLLDDDRLCDRLTEYNYLYPEWLFNVGGSYTWEKAHLSFSVNGTYVGSRWASQSNRLENLPSDDNHGTDAKAYHLPHYFLANAKISTVDLELAPLGPFTLSAAVYNFLNSAIVEPGFGGIDIPQRGTTLMFSFNQQI